MCCSGAGFLFQRYQGAKVWCDAAGVSEVGNMAYMTRLGLWGPGSAFPRCACLPHREGAVIALGRKTALLLAIAVLHSHDRLCGERLPGLGQCRAEQQQLAGTCLKLASQM